MKTLRKWIAIGAAAAVVLTGCSKTSTSTGGGGSGSSQAAIDPKDLVLVASVINTTNPYMASMIQGAQALGKKLNVPVQIVDSAGSSQTEISKIQAILAQGKKVVLMVNTVASSDAPTIVNAVKAAGGFVTVWWNKPDSLEPWDIGDNFVAFQKYSGVESGECTAKALAEGIGKKGNVIALAGVLDSTTSQTRVAGLKEGLKAYPNVKLLDVQSANWDPQQGLKVTQNLLTKYPNQVNGIWAADDAMIIGASQATKKANVYSKVKLASDGLYPDVVAQMQAANSPVVAETFHRGFMAASIGLYTAYLAATGKIQPSTLPHEKRDSLFKLVCVTPQNFQQYTKWDNQIDSWIDTLIAHDPWTTDPTPLVGGGPEKMPS
jgi:ribose transport system substrate-binding protein